MWTGNEVAITPVEENRPGDVPIYLSDCSRLYALTSWRPQHDPRSVLSDILGWSVLHERALREALGFDN